MFSFIHELQVFGYKIQTETAIHVRSILIYTNLILSDICMWEPLKHTCFLSIKPCFIFQVEVPAWEVNVHTFKHASATHTHTHARANRHTHRDWHISIVNHTACSHNSINHQLKMIIIKSCQRPMTASLFLTASLSLPLLSLTLFLY